MIPAYIFNFIHFSSTTTTYHSPKILFMALCLYLRYLFSLDCPSTCPLPLHYAQQRLPWSSLLSAQGTLSVMVSMIPSPFTQLCRTVSSLVFYNLMSQTVIYAPAALPFPCDSCAHYVKIQILIQQFWTGAGEHSILTNAPNDTNATDLKTILRAARFIVYLVNISLSFLTF